MKKYNASQSDLTVVSQLVKSSEPRRGGRSQEKGQTGNKEVGLLRLRFYSPRRLHRDRAWYKVGVLGSIFFGALTALRELFLAVGPRAGVELAPKQLFWADGPSTGHTFWLVEGKNRFFKPSMGINWY